MKKVRGVRSGDLFLGVGDPWFGLGTCDITLSVFVLV